MSDDSNTTEDAFTAAYQADMWRVDVAGYPIMVRGQVARTHLEQVNRNLAVMKLALHKISAIARRQGEVGEVARDAIRACRDA
jgi:hypothetical protein